MKILVYTPTWSIGGIERVIQCLCQEFERHGDTATFSILVENVPGPGEAFEMPANATIYHRRIGSFTEDARLALRDFVCWQDPDVVVVMGSTRRLYCIPRALVDTEYPVILSEHNSDELIVKNFRSDWRFLNAVRNSADVCHVLSGQFTRRFDAGVDVRVIGNSTPSDVPCVSGATLDGARRIVCTSRYDWTQKQPDVLVRAFSLIAADHPDWTLAFYGADWRGGKARLTGLVHELGLDSQVELNDSIDDISEVLVGASLFAFSSAYEGFGLSLAEAMAHGLPCVCTNFEGIPDFVEPGRNVLVVPGGCRNVEGLAETLSGLMADSSARRELSRRARETGTGEELCPETFYRKWKAMLDDVAARKGINRLLTLSPMERAYILHETSGLLFDQLAGAREAARKAQVGAEKFERVTRLLRRLHLLAVARFLWSRSRSRRR